MATLYDLPLMFARRGGASSEGGSVFVCFGVVAAFVLGLYIYGKWCERIRREKDRQVESDWLHRAKTWSDQRSEELASGLAIELSKAREECKNAIERVPQRLALQNLSAFSINHLIPRLNQWEQQARRAIEQADNPRSEKKRGRQRK